MGAPLLIGAGIGALGSAVTGGSPIKGALLGGAGGALTGGMSSLLSGGSFLEGAGLGSAASVGASAGVPSTAAQFEASMGLPSSAYYGAGGVGMGGMNTIGSMGLQYNPTTGTYLNPSDYVGTSVGIPTYTGGQGTLSNAMGDLKSKIPDWVTPQNMMGAANVASKFTPQQVTLPTAQGGGITHGSFQPKTSSLSTGDLLERKRFNPFLLG